MQEVTVSRLDLIRRIVENRERHHKIVEEALVGYRKAVIEELDKMIAFAKEGRKIQTRVGLIQPQDHTVDYDAVIDMLTMSTDDTIVLSQSDFRAYVRDEWAWKGQFLMSNSSYSMSAMRDYAEGEE